MLYNPPQEKKGYSITLFTDSMNSWIIPWVQQIKDILSPFHNVTTCYRKDDLSEGDFNFLLGCTKILEKEFLCLHRHNLVVHESDLPLGKGWSPLSWQIVQGASEIPVVLFETGEQLDGGPIFIKDRIVFQGNELLPEIRIKQGLKTIELVLKFLNQWPDITPLMQSGEDSYYRKRTEKDDRLDIKKSIAEQFNHLRIIDNQKYPAWFEIRGKKFKILIYDYK